MLILHVLTVLVFWFWVLLMPKSQALSRSLRLCPWSSICFMAPSSKILGSAPPAPLPSVEKRDAQHKFLQHKGANTDRRGSKKGRSKRHLDGRNTPFREYDPPSCAPYKKITNFYCRANSVWQILHQHYRIEFPEQFGNVDPRIRQFSARTSH